MNNIPSLVRDTLGRGFKRSLVLQNTHYDVRPTLVADNEH